MPYAFCEQIGNEIRDISDEIPFEIPDSWEWCRISNLFQLINGDRGKNYPSKEKLHESGEIPFISAINMQNGTVNKSNLLYVDKEQYDKLNSGKLFQNDLVVCIRGSLGKFCIYPFDIGAIASSLVILRRFGEINNDFLALYIQSPLFFDEIRKYDNGTAQPNLSAKDLSDFFLPIPPLSEQKRIVAKIEELLPYIEKYGKAEEHLTTLNTTFPEALKKSILQEAVQGKLVPQNPDDEPASVLLERIRAEKQELIKAGKIKKDKHESVIVTRDKIPYEIPDSWEWCKLSDLAILENGDRSSKYPVEADYVESGIPFFGAKDIDGEMMSFQNVRFISQQKYDELGNGKLVDGDIICLLRGSVGKTAKFEANEQFDTGFICAQMLIIRLLDKSLFGYISSYFKSPDYTNYVESKVTGTAVRQMPAKEMGNLLIPLPPLNEQHRIVAKIEEIMPYINTITK